MTSTVELGEKVRKQEAMDGLVDEISRGEDESLAPSLRSAFERGWGFDFSTTITEAKVKREKEIDKICSRHYGDFLASVKELLEMRGSADLISRSITDVHEVFDDAYADLSTILKTLESLQIERENSRNALDDIQKCKELTALMVNAKECVASEDYYRALSIIESLRDALNKVGMRSFSSTLMKWLAQLTDQLLTAAKVDMQNWLSNMKQINSLVGETFMRTCAATYVRSSTLTTGGAGSVDDDIVGATLVLESPICMSTDTVQHLADLYGWDLLDYSCHIDKTIPVDWEQEVSAEGRECVDSITERCGPLHKALHMHSRLDRMAQLQGIYCESRELIIVHNLVTSAMEADIKTKGFEAVFPEVMHAVCGFFATESIVRRSVANPEGGGVFTWNQLKDLWLIACSEVRECLVRHGISISSVEAMLQVKEGLLLAAETLGDDAFGFRDGALMETCTVLWEPFLKLLVNSVSENISKCLGNLAYQPMYVTSEFVHDEMIKPFFLDKAHFSLDEQAGSIQDGGRTNTSTNASLDALEEAQMEKLRGSIASIDDAIDVRQSTETGSPGRWDREAPANHSNFVPHTLPFSEIVPYTMKHLHMVIIYCSQFVAHNDALGERGSSVCKTFENCIGALTIELQVELTKDGAETPLSKACQIYVDACSLSYCMQGFRENVANMLTQSNWIESIDSYLDDVIARSRSTLDTLANQSQDLIFELLNAKVLDLLGSMCFVNWVPSVMPSGPHECIEEIVEYLKVTFMWLSHLPLTVREAAHFTCCSKINQEIIGFLLSTKVPHLNMLSARALVLDFIYLERFAIDCGISQLKECFAEGKSIVNALVHPDLPSFGDDPPILRRANFPLLDVYKFSVIVEKLTPLPAGAQTHASVPHYDKKALSSLTKALKSAKY